jgi:hypothetical protein
VDEEPLLICHAGRVLPLEGHGDEGELSLRVVKVAVVALQREAAGRSAESAVRASRQDARA